ncbi:MAG: c-type cytochrome [Saprospiraceae bacterium]
MTSIQHLRGKTDSLGLSMELGRQLFNSNCAACHNKNVKDNLTGPALGGSTVRWAIFPKTDLYNWIRNS